VLPTESCTAHRAKCFTTACSSCQHLVKNILMVHWYLTLSMSAFERAVTALHRMYSRVYLLFASCSVASSSIQTCTSRSFRFKSSVGLFSAGFGFCLLACY